MGKYQGDDPLERWRKHVRTALNGSKYFFHKAIRKYGSDAFKVKKIAEGASHTELDKLERFHIKRLRSNQQEFGYNMTVGGDTVEGLRHSIETRKKIGDSCRGRKMPLSFSKHLAERNRKNHPRLGMKTSEARKELNRVAMRTYWDGLSTEERKVRMAYMKKPKSEAMKARISKTLKGRKLSEQHCKNQSEGHWCARALKGDPEALAHFLPRFIQRMAGRE